MTSFSGSAANASDRSAYVQQVLRSVKPAGHVIVATFAEDGPTQCNGLAVVRYRADQSLDINPQALSESAR